MLFKKKAENDFVDFNLNPGESIEFLKPDENLIFPLSNDQLQTAINCLMNYIDSGKDVDMLCKCTEFLTALLYVQIARADMGLIQGSE